MASVNSSSTLGNHFELNPNAPVFGPACHRVNVSADINTLADRINMSSALNPGAPIFCIGRVIQSPILDPGAPIFCPEESKDDEDISDVVSEGGIFDNTPPVLELFTPENSFDYRDGPPSSLCLFGATYHFINYIEFVSYHFICVLSLYVTFALVLTVMSLVALLVAGIRHIVFCKH